MRQQQRPANACERAGQRGNDNERIEPRLKIDDNQEISKHDRPEQAQAQSGKGTLHSLDLTANDDVAALRQILLDGLDELFDFVGDAAEVAAIHSRVDVDHRLRGVVRDFRGPGGRRGGDQVSENLRPRTRHAAADGSILQRLVGVHAILRLLHRNGILHAVFRIQPESRGSLKAGAERNKNVLRHVARLHANGLGAGPVDFHIERRIIKGLLNVDIYRAGNVTELAGEFFPDKIISALIHAGDFHVDGRGSAEIQNLRHDVRRLKKELHAGKTLRKLFAQFVDVRASGPAAHFLQLDKKFRVGAPDSAGVAVGEVDAAVRQADIVENGGELVLRDGFANDAVNLVGEARRFLNAQACACAHVQANLSGVNLRKEIAAENSDEQDRETAESQKAYGEEPGRTQSRPQGSSVAFPEFFKIPLEALLIAAEETHSFSDVLFGVIFVLRTEEIHGQSRHDGARPHVGGQHGEAHGFGKRNEQEFSHAGEKKHGNEDDANAERGNKSGHGNLLRAVEDGLDGFLAHRQVAVDVFDFNGGVVDEDADSEREPAQRHDINGLAEGAETKNAHENGQRDRDGNDQGAFPVSEEEQNHHSREAGGDDCLSNDTLDGSAHVERLIEESRDVQAFGNRAFVVLQHLLDAVDDVDGGSSAGLVDAHEHAALTVRQNDVGLRGKPVAHVSDVLHVNRRAVDGFDREIVEFLDGLRAAIHLHVVLEGAELRRSRGENQVLRVDRVYDINGGKPLGLECRGIDINADDALLAAVGERRGGTRHGRELRTDKIVAVIEELLLAHRVAGQADLNDRHGRRRIDDHQRRRGSGREESQKSLRNSGGLGQRGLNIGAWLKENFNDGDAVKRLRFDVLNVIHQHGDAALDVGGDALLHFLGLETVVSPNQ